MGPVWTYVVLSFPTAGLMTTTFLLRKRLLVVEYGTSAPLIALAAVAAVAAITIQVKRRRYLTKAILTGIPELSRQQTPGELLTEGIYGTIRHPRYVEVWLFILAYSFLCNHLALYVAVMLTLPTLYLVVLLEERELRQRFGVEYEEYCDRVPRVFPMRRTSR